MKPKTNRLFKKKIEFQYLIVSSVILIFIFLLASLFISRLCPKQASSPQPAKSRIPEILYQDQPVTISFTPAQEDDWFVNESKIIYLTLNTQDEDFTLSAFDLKLTTDDFITLNSITQPFEKEIIKNLAQKRLAYATSDNLTSQLTITLNLTTAQAGQACLAVSNESQVVGPNPPGTDFDYLLNSSPLCLEVEENVCRRECDDDEDCGEDYDCWAEEPPAQKHCYLDDCPAWQQTIDCVCPSPTPTPISALDALDSDSIPALDSDRRI